MTSPFAVGLTLPPTKPLPSTVFGTSSSDYLFGTDADNHIYGFAGDDYIWGFGGNDSIYGGSGHDQVYAGNGDTYVSLGSGNDFAQTGIGDSTVNAGSGNDIIEVGIELVWATYQIANPEGVLETFWYSYANEWAGGDNIVHAGSGDDFVIAHGGDDKLYGGSGDDYLNGGNGNDKLYGGAGNDILFGGQGNDLLNGGEGDDLIYVGGDRVQLGGLFGGADHVRFAQDGTSVGKEAIVRIIGGDAGDMIDVYDWQTVTRTDDSVRVTDIYGTNVLYVGDEVQLMGISIIDTSTDGKG